ncbi:MAG: tRNA (adenosine(37)-N6)-dimethylallyltransferase MiaA [Saprospiraceae bacterium]|nr:tRNA (adenosine(37)-N6)-dimethylallyltransferase MiaA [Saprospiraceae bacterium]
MPSKSNKYVVAVAGPTAVGKTGIAIALAEHFDTVVLSADSRQMYRQMSIGTAKPTAEELARATHYFVDSLDITDRYSAGIWAREALALLDDLFQQHDLVIVTGGSGLYLRALLDGFDEMPDVPESYRTYWEETLETSGLAVLQTALQHRDPAYYAEVDHHNPHRLIRALTVIDYTGQPFSSFRREQQASRPFGAIRIFCNRPRDELYDRINRRVDAMIARGLVREAESLVRYQELQALQTVGYTEIFAYLAGKWDLETAIEKIKQHTRNYAKRQVTWFSNQGVWREFNPPEWQEIAEYITRKAGIA